MRKMAFLTIFLGLTILITGICSPVSAIGTVETFYYYLPGAEYQLPGETGKAYRMMAIPVLPEDIDVFDNLKDFFGGAANPALWRLYKQSASSYFEILQRGDDFIDYGKAWWIIALHDTYIELAGTPASVPGEYQIPMPGGSWRMISNPFWDREIDWTAVIDDASNQPLNCGTTIYRWGEDGNYFSDTYLPTGEGAWAWTQNSGPLTIKDTMVCCEYSASPKPSPAVQIPSMMPPPPLAPGAGITVMSPSSGAVLKKFRKTAIEWKAIGIDPQGFSGGVNIALSTDGGDTYTDIANNVQDTGSYNWRIPRWAKSAQCLIRITSVLYPELSDISDGPFTIR